MQAYDIEKIRAEFPVTTRWAYFNHAALGPLTRRAAHDMREHVADVELHGSIHWRGWCRQEDEIRSMAAQMIGADASEVAFVKNTSEGVNLVARGLALRTGDVVVTVEGEFAANVTPWLALRDQGVRVKFVPDRGGRILLNDIDQALTPDVKVLAISQVEYLSGFRNDLEAIGKLCDERRVFLFVDAIQGLGALPIDVKRHRIDALAADGHKWLCSPEGAGILYISQPAQERVQVVHHGWLHAARMGRFADYYAPLRRDARRYEPGTLNHVGLAGLAGSLKTLLAYDPEYIETRVLDLAGHIAQGVTEKGYQILGSRESRETSGIVSFSKDGVDALRAEQQLLEKKIVIGTREGFLRVAPHFYNTRDEVEALLAALP